jgi:general secretion pathway protein G
MTIHNRRRRAQRGFSLIEIMVVLLIIGMIASLVTVAAFRNQAAARVQVAQVEVRSLANAVQLFAMEHGAPPDALAQLVPRQLSELKKDPWGNDYGYRREGAAFEIRSLGPDGAQGGGDDVVRRVGYDTQLTDGL